MNREQAEKLKLKSSIFHKGYESKVLEIKENRATWYDRDLDRILNGKITDIEFDEIHLVSDDGIRAVFRRWEKWKILYLF